MIKAHEKGQPVLVGTITIDISEEISRLLKKAGIQHKVLNAKFHEMEAEIVADAGLHGAVTIATNMAGRGTCLLYTSLFADVGSVFFLFILIETFAGRNGKVTILKLC